MSSQFRIGVVIGETGPAFATSVYEEDESDDDDPPPIVKDGEGENKNPVPYIDLRLVSIILCCLLYMCAFSALRAHVAEQK